MLLLYECLHFLSLKHYTSVHQYKYILHSICCVTYKQHPYMWEHLSHYLFIGMYSAQCEWFKWCLNFQDKWTKRDKLFKISVWYTWHVLIYLCLYILNHKYPELEMFMILIFFCNISIIMIKCTFCIKQLLQLQPKHKIHIHILHIYSTEVVSEVIFMSFQEKDVIGTPVIRPHWDNRYSNLKRKTSSNSNIWHLPTSQSFLLLLLSTT